jgi:glycosyltransferase involved in cell wall biosynthesis
VYGPVSIEKFLPLERKPEDFYLFFGQLTGYKRADIAINACIQSGRKLVVAGAGADKKLLRNYEKNTLISFAGRVSDEEAASLLSRARALLFPGIEDFGIIPVEANAAGCPVIAFRQGGVLDTIQEDVTGVFFDEQSPASLIRALDQFEAMEQNFSRREVFSRQVRQFSREAFMERIRSIIEEQKRL